MENLLSRLVLGWLITLGLATVLVGFIRFLPLRPVKGTISICCQDVENTFMAYQWLSESTTSAYDQIGQLKGLMVGEAEDVCVEKRIGFWGWLFGRNRPKEKGFIVTELCELQGFLSRILETIRDPWRWFHDIKEIGLWTACKQSAQSISVTFQNAWREFVDVPGMSQSQAKSESFIFGNWCIRCFDYLTAFLVCGCIWMLGTISSPYLPGVIQRIRNVAKFGRKKTALVRAITTNYFAVKHIWTGQNFSFFHMVTKDTNEAVFIKCLRKTSTREARIGLAREYRATKKLLHPNIVRFIDWIHCGMYQSLVLEFAPFGCLQAAVTLPEARLMDKLSIFNQVVKAVEFLHKLNAAHLNIRPGTVFVFNKWQCIKLSGFTHIIMVGKTTTCTRYDLHNSSCPNEVVSKTLYNPFKADIWALGSLLYFILTGIVFQSETKVPVARVILSALKGCNIATKRRILEILAGLLSCDPELRPEMLELQRDLNSVV